MQKEKWLFEAIPNCRPKAKIDPGKLHCGESRRPARLDGIIAPPDRRPAAITATITVRACRHRSDFPVVWSPNCRKDLGNSVRHRDLMD
jgi:hypothetical protein